MADNSNGDFKELSMKFILEIIDFVYLMIFVFIHKYVTGE